jgi:soluble lytic murein transglycosylase
VKSPLYPLLVLAALTAAQSVHAQQGGVTILRGTSNDQPANGTPDTGVRRVPNGGSTAAPTPAPKPAVPPAAAAQPINEGTGIIPPPTPSETAQVLGGAAKPLSPAEAASLAAAIKAVDESRWADARAAVASFRNTLLDRYVEWSILRVAPRTDAGFSATWRFLRESPDWPEPEVLRRQAEDRIGPETSPQEVFRYFTAFPPLTSTGHMRRMEAAQVASPNDLKKFASDSWRGATFRNADENDFLNRYGTAGVAPPSATPTRTTS